MSLDPSRVPASVRELIPLAEQWGEPDDGLRDDRVMTASDTELAHLVATMDAADEELDSWLCGEESRSPAPTREYVAFSSLFMAYELARLTLRKRQ